MQLAHILQQVESVWLYQLMDHFKYLHYGILQFSAGQVKPRRVIGLQKDGCNPGHYKK